MIHFVSQLSEFRAAMVPITEQGWISRLFRLNRNEDILDTFDRRLTKAQQRFMVSSILLLVSAMLMMIGIVKVGIVTQTRVEASQFQKDTADSLVCPVSYDDFTDHSLQLTEYSKPSPFVFNRLILIPDYRSIWHTHTAVELP